MISSKLIKEPVGVLSRANTLSIERYQKPLRDINEQYQRDLVIEARDQCMKTCEWCLLPIIESGPDSRSWTSSPLLKHHYHVDCYNTMNDEWLERMEDDTCVD